MTVITQKKDTAPTEALSNRVVVGMLRDLMAFYGFDPDTKDVQEKGLVAKKLGDAVGEDWSYLYVHNVLKEKIPPSKKMKAAIMMLGAQADGVPLILSKAREMKLFVVGNVQPGSVVLGDSRACANPRCRVSFVPKYIFQTHCCPACTVEHAQIRKGQKRASSPSGKLRAAPGRPGSHGA